MVSDWYDEKGDKEELGPQNCAAIWLSWIQSQFLMQFLQQYSFKVCKTQDTWSFDFNCGDDIDSDMGEDTDNHNLEQQHDIVIMLPWIQLQFQI